MGTKVFIGRKVAMVTNKKAPLSYLAFPGLILGRLSPRPPRSIHFREEDVRADVRDLYYCASLLCA